MAENQKEFNILPKVLNGGIAAMIGLTATFPLDLVKTRLQKQQPLPDGSKMYSSLVDALRKIYKTEGIPGLYSGATVVVLLITPMQTVRFSANDYFRFNLKNKTTNILSPFRQGLAGALTGVVQLVITVPMELLKIQLQDAGRVAAIAKLTGKEELPKVSVIKVVSHIAKTKGFFGFYKGTIPTLCRDVPFCALYFPLFATIDSLGPRRSDGSGESKFYWSFFCALFTSAFSALMVTPADIMKTRIQNVSQGAAGDKIYTSIFDAFRDILKNEGFLAFYKGGTCRMLVLAPTYALIQTIYFLGVAEKLFGIKRDVKMVKK